jgi:hypothetical protein
MRSVPVRIVGTADRASAARAAELFASTHTLAALLRWAHTQRPQVPVLEIVTQDEFTHDVVLPFAPAFLSFDTT